MKKKFVAILMGSHSDAAVLEHAWMELKNLQIPFEVNILSAHRTPDETRAYVKEAEERGCAIFIAAAGLAAHLAGAVAAQTLCPVIGIPLDAGGLGGMDALLSTVQMPGGTPVACMSIGKAGAKNAALFAAQILALENTEIKNKLMATRVAKKEELFRAGQALKESGAGAGTHSGTL